MLGFWWVRLLGRQFFCRVVGVGGGKLDTVPGNHIRISLGHQLLIFLKGERRLHRRVCKTLLQTSCGTETLHIKGVHFSSPCKKAPYASLEGEGSCSGQKQPSNSPWPSRFLTGAVQRASSTPALEGHWHRNCGQSAL